MERAGPRCREMRNVSREEHMLVYIETRAFLKPLPGLKTSLVWFLEQATRLLDIIFILIT